METYHAERYAAARENLAVTEATIRFMVPPSRSRRWIRAVLLRLAKPIGAVRRHINSGRMAEPYVYADSPLVDATSGHPLIGHFAPDGWVSAAGRRERIRSAVRRAVRRRVLRHGRERGPAVRQRGVPRRSAMPTRLVLVLPAGTEIGDCPPRSPWCTTKTLGCGRITTSGGPPGCSSGPTGTSRRPATPRAPAGHPAALLHAALLRCARADGHQSITEKEVTDVAG